MRFVRGEDAAPAEDVPDRRKMEVPQQAAELALRAVGVDRMAELAEPAHAHLGLVDVQLPRMQVDDGRLLLALIEVLDGESGHRVRQEAEVSASRDGQAAPKERDGGEWELRDAVPI